MPIFQKPSLKSGTQKKREMPEGLWQKCPECGEVIHNLELAKNLKVCPKCDHHFTLSAAERIHNLLDPDSFTEFDANLISKDVLKFTGIAAYSDRLSSYQEKTGMKDAVVTGFGKIEKKAVAIAVMDFNFLAATMGSVVGEKITRVIEKATAAKHPLIIVAASGGARMYEGMLSLMQMAKTSGALARHAEAFAGPRVIRETTHQDLPAGFQTAEFLLGHGFIDLIVRRPELRPTLSQLLDYLGGTN